MAAKKGRRKKRPKLPPQPRKGLGRPTVFSEVVKTKILELAEAGHTEDEIANFIGVHPNTLLLWKRKHADLMWALKSAKAFADELVEASLFRRACGYSHQAVKHFLDKQIQVDEDGNKVMKTVILEKEYTEHYPPSEVAAIFWLKNRQPERWRDKPDQSSNDDSKSEVVYESEWGNTNELPDDDDKNSSENK